MDTTQNTCREFVDLLGSKAPTPGGGGASAFVGALGVALSHMVGSLTVGKKKYAAVEEEIRGYMACAESLQTRLLDLVKQDAMAFSPLAKAYGMPAETPEEQAEKERVMEQCLQTACQAPLDIMRACGQGIELAELFADKGSRLALSDAGVSATFARAALEGASLNVYINTGLMKDRLRAKALDEEADALLQEYVPRAENVLASVQQAVRKGHG